MDKCDICRKENIIISDYFCLVCPTCRDLNLPRYVLQRIGYLVEKNEMLERLVKTKVKLSKSMEIELNNKNDIIKFFKFMEFRDRFVKKNKALYTPKQIRDIVIEHQKELGIFKNYNLLLRSDITKFHLILNKYIGKSIDGIIMRIAMPNNRSSRVKYAFEKI